VLTFSTPIAVTNGTQYAIASLIDNSLVFVGSDTSAGTYYFVASTYPTFPNPLAGASSSPLTWAQEAGVDAAGSTYTKAMYATQDSSAPASRRSVVVITKAGRARVGLHASGVTVPMTPPTGMVDRSVRCREVHPSERRSTRSPGSGCRAGRSTGAA
jgi:hypothetical protein